MLIRPAELARIRDGEVDLAFRTLKELGLTESLEVGYRISPRGQVQLDGLGPEPDPG